MSLTDTLHSDFDAFCKAVLPDEFADANDQRVLRMTWMAATRQASARLSFVGNAPIHKAAEDEFTKLKAEMEQAA